MRLIDMAKRIQCRIADYAPVRGFMNTRGVSNLTITIGILYYSWCAQAAAGVDVRHVETSTGTIFSKEVSRVARVCAELRYCWTPSRADIEILEQDLSTFLAKSKVWGAEDIAQNLPSYKQNTMDLREMAHAIS
jgi:hypothetical protein